MKRDWNMKFVKRNNRKQILAMAVISTSMLICEISFAACNVEKKIGNTWLCKGGKAIYKGIDKNGWRGTWKRVNATKVQICLPDESGKFGYEVKSG